MQHLREIYPTASASAAARLGAAETEPGAAALEKETALRHLMREMKSVLVAYSGGVDSAYLALVAWQELGTKAAAVTGLSPSVSAHQRHEAERVAAEFGFEHFVVETHEIEREQYRVNRPDRCYFCKAELYDKLDLIAKDRGFSFMADGTNADDLVDHRPGRVAAEERGVCSPLAEVGLGKAEIRQLSRRLGLPTWDKPASPCLASRVAHGMPVTIQRLKQVEEGEDFLRSLGFIEFRLRVHGEIARLEIAAEEMEKIFDIETRAAVAGELHRLGFRYVTLDLEGFRTGSMNPV